MRDGLADGITSSLLSPDAVSTGIAQHDTMDHFIILIAQNCEIEKVTPITSDVPIVGTFSPSWWLL